MLSAVTDNLQNLSGSTHEKYFSHSWQGPCQSAWEFISHYSETHVPSVTCGFMIILASFCWQRRNKRGRIESRPVAHTHIAFPQILVENSAVVLFSLDAAERWGLAVCPRRRADEFGLHQPGLLHSAYFWKMKVVRISNSLGCLKM